VAVSRCSESWPSRHSLSACSVVAARANKVLGPRLGPQAASAPQALDGSDLQRHVLACCWTASWLSLFGVEQLSGVKWLGCVAHAAVAWVHTIVFDLRKGSESGRVFERQQPGASNLKRGANLSNGVCELFTMLGLHHVEGGTVSTAALTGCAGKAGGGWLRSTARCSSGKAPPAATPSCAANCCCLPSGVPMSTSSPSSSSSAPGAAAAMQGSQMERMEHRAVSAPAARRPSQALPGKPMCHFRAAGRLSTID
jgi:hypothetical protein